MIRATKRVAALLGAGALAIATAARAEDAKPPEQPPRELVTVTTHGRATAPADEVELEVVVSGSGEEAVEAERKHRERLQKVIASLSGKKTDGEPKDKKRKKRREKAGGGEEGEGAAEGDESIATAAAGIPVSVREGPSVTGVQARNPNHQEFDEQGNQKLKETQFRVASAVVVTLKGIAAVSTAALRYKLCQLLDRAADGGAETGAGKDESARPALRFRVADPEALRQKAYLDAMVKARARAEELARLGGRSIRLASITEQDLSGSRSDDGSTPPGLDAVILDLGQRNDPLERTGVSATTHVAIEVALTVEWELKERK